MSISVAMCTYNGEQYIAEQLNSILNQTVAVDEIVICDDGSADTTLEIAQNILQGSEISFQIQRNKQTQGVASNFLNCLKMTTGDYCFTCDQDDIWFPDKVERFLEHAKQSEKDLYFSDGVLIDGNANPCGCNLWQAYGIDYDKVMAEPLIHTLVKRPIVTGAAMMLSRRIIDQVSYVPSGILHDEWFSLVAAATDSIQPINAPTFFYRQHGKNVVGARKSGGFQRVRLWYKRLTEGMTSLRNSQAVRLKAVAMATENGSYRKFTDDAVYFWNVMVSLRSLGRWQQIWIATKLFLKGQYGLYYTGLRGYVRDLLTALLGTATA